MTSSSKRWSRKWSVKGPSRGQWGAAALALMVPTAHAGSVSLGNGLSMDWLANLTYSAAVRVDDPDEALKANINGDDATRNFEKGELINNRLALLAETDFRFGRYGAFVRGSAFYDDVYRSRNDNDSPETVNKTGDNDEFSEAARKYLGARARLLDAYVYGSFAVGETSLDVRLGRQVVSWGESLFFPNMSGAQGPVDSTKSNVAGTEVKDILLPEEQILLQWGLSSSFSVAAYYQTNWKATELTPVGGYFSTSDVVGEGAEFLIVPQLPGPLSRVARGRDITPDDDGQWGVSAKWLVGEASEIGFYHLNYHDKAPVGVITNISLIDFGDGVQRPIPTGYQVVYTDDIKLSAISLSTDLGGTAIGSEVSLRQDAGMSVNVAAGGSVTGTPGRGDVVQANLNFTRLILPTRFWDTLTLLGEASWLRVIDVDPITGPDGAQNEHPTNGREAAAIQALAQLGYKQVFPGWDMTLSFVYADLFKGKSAIGGALGSLTGEGDKRYTGGVTMKYLSNLELQMAYNGYGGTPNADRPLADRSYVSFSAKYSF